ncbi:DUF6215 domain-containing protein [Streptomyces sp. NPDC093225]|uniref:DUF6215 domain-containing protein n=1 Tax=Streptomyces sp. NPDC093225 TaxID=3366034 RepID=UPI003826BC8D
MLGLILRILPFWIREPLLIVLGSVLGARLVYVDLPAHDWLGVGLGLLFLAFTAVRINWVVRALRARRNPAPATPAPAPGTPVAATPAEAAGPARAAAVPRPGPAAPVKEPNAWGQAFAAVALIGGLAAAAWVGPRFLPSDEITPPPPASCEDGETKEPPTAFPKPPRTPRAVTGDELCRALDLPGLARLLGTPGETATTVSSSNGTAPLTGGKIAQPEVEVAFDTYSVNVSATYNDLSIGQYVKLMKFGNEIDVKTRSVMGRPAVLSSDHTMKISINLGGAGGSGGPVEQGPLARTLSVALDRKDRGGYCEITVWSKTGVLPDDGVLLAIADKVLPVIPERTGR